MNYPPQIHYQLPNTINTFQPPRFPQSSFNSINTDPQNYQVFYSNRPLQNINCIIDPTQQAGGVYLGDILCLLKKQLLTNNNIGALLTCITRSQCLKSNVDYDRPNLPTSITMHKILSVSDTLEYPLNVHFDDTYDFIERARKGKKNVLVHCHAGVSRSATILCAYLMRKQGYSLNQALTLMKSKRSRVKPNQNFLEILNKYETQLRQNVDGYYDGYGKKQNKQSEKNIKEGKKSEKEEKFKMQDSIEPREVGADPKQQNTINQTSQKFSFNQDDRSKNAEQPNPPKINEGKKSLQSYMVYSRKHESNQVNDLSRKTHVFEGSYTKFSYDSFGKSGHQQKQMLDSIKSRQQKFSEPLEQVRSRPKLQHNLSYDNLYASPRLEANNSKKEKKDIKEALSQNGTVSYLTVEGPQNNAKYAYSLQEKKEGSQKEDQKRRNKLFKEKKKEGRGNCILEGIKNFCM